jgi:hypothetical protein
MFQLSNTSKAEANIDASMNGKRVVKVLCALHNFVDGPPKELEDIQPITIVYAAVYRGMSVVWAQDSRFKPVVGGIVPVLLRLENTNAE